MISSNFSARVKNTLIANVDVDKNFPLLSLFLSLTHTFPEKIHPNWRQVCLPVFPCTYNMCLWSITDSDAGRRPNELLFFSGDILRSTCLMKMLMPKSTMSVGSNKRLWDVNKYNPTLYYITFMQYDRKYEIYIGLSSVRVGQRWSNKTYKHAWFSERQTPKSVERHYFFDYFLITFIIYYF